MRSDQPRYGDLLESVRTFLGVLVILAASAGPSAFAQDAATKEPWVEFAPCRYQRNIAYFDLEHCNRVFDDPLALMRTDPKRWYLLIDGYAFADEKHDLARRRAGGAWFHVVYNMGERPDRILLRWKHMPTNSGRDDPAVRVWLVEWGKPFPLLEGGTARESCRSERRRGAHGGGRTRAPDGRGLAGAEMRAR